MSAFRQLGLVDDGQGATPERQVKASSGDTPLTLRIRRHPRHHRLIVAWLAAAVLVASGGGQQVHADMPADVALLFADLCVESGLTTDGLVAAFARVTDGEQALRPLVSDRETIYSQEILVGAISFTLLAIAPANSSKLRQCRVAAEFADAAGVEVHLDRLFPDAKRTPPTIQRMSIGQQQLFSVSAQWLSPRQGVGAVHFTVEVFGKRRKATLTAVPS